MTGRPKVFVSAGEVSGDLILASILTRLRERHPEMELRGLGGAASEACGLKPLFPLEKTAFSGAWDVLRRAVFAVKMLRRAVRVLKEFRPDLLLLVDYPGLNLRLARAACNLGVTVYYVAPPQVWVYRDPRRKIRRAAAALSSAHLHVLFPFEADYFKFAAHPIVTGHFLDMSRGDRAEAETGWDQSDVEGRGQMRRATQPAAPSLAKSAASRGLLCLCPGSRLPVLERNLRAWMNRLDQVDSKDAGPAFERIAILVPEHLRVTTEKFLRKYRMGAEAVVRSDKQNALVEARAAIAFPGTITLELALHRVPTLVLAVLDPLTLTLGRRLLRDQWLALPNLLLRENVFPEWAGTAAQLDETAFREALAALQNRAFQWDDLSSRLRERIGAGDGSRAAAQACDAILARFSRPFFEKVTAI